MSVRFFTVVPVKKVETLQFGMEKRNNDRLMEGAHAGVNTCMNYLFMLTL